MICKNCNMDNPDGARFCTNCSYPLDETVVENNQQNVQYNQNAQSSQYNPNTINYNNEVLEYKPASAIIAIVVSILCCGGIIGAIFAILSLVEGSKVKTFMQKGDIISARNSLEQAKKWNKIAWIIVAVFAVLVLLYFAFVFVVSMLEAMAY